MGRAHHVRLDFCAMKPSIKKRAVRKAHRRAELRTIAEVPFRGTVSVRRIEAAIEAVMAKRKPEVDAAVRIPLPHEQVPAGAEK
jgi:hypothetical protein